MIRYAFFFDGTRCTGCKTCEFACKDYKDLGRGFAYRKVYEMTSGDTFRKEDGTFKSTCVSYALSMACNHCRNPECVNVCPTGAMHKDSETDLVVVNTDKCIGCGYCHMSCPYDAPQVDREKGHSVKCDGCIERITEGKKPVCVESCPARALDFGAVGDMQQLGKQAQSAPLPSPLYTDPSFYLKPSADAQSGEGANITISNPLEVQ